MAGGLGGERVGVGAWEVKGLKANGSFAKLWHWCILPIFVIMVGLQPRTQKHYELH